METYRHDAAFSLLLGAVLPLPSTTVPRAPAMTWTSTSNTDRTKPLAGQTLIDPDDGEIDEGDEWAGEEVDDKVEEIEYVIDENDEPTLTRDNADDVAWDMDVVDEEDAEDELEENEDIWDDDDVAA